MDLEFNLLPTGIGSMPHLDVQKACDFILKNFNVFPFWPQLPRLGFKENMYVQFAYDLPCVVVDVETKKIYVDLENRKLQEIDDFYTKLTHENLSYDEEYFKGFYGMLKNKEKIKDVKALKGQIIGPISLGFALTDTYHKPILYNDFYFELLIQALNKKAKIQAQYLKSISKSVILIFDEPTLSLFGTPYLNLTGEKIINILTEVCKGLDCIVGIHCCGNTDWSLILETPIEIISFDAYSYGERLALYSNELKNFIANGALAIGIVPSDEEKFLSENLDSLCLKFDSILKLFTKRGIDEKDLISKSLLTSTCGLATMSIEHAECALKTTKALSQMLRERYGILDENI